MTDRQKLKRNISRALYFHFFQAFMVLVPVAVPFFQSKGLTMRDVFTLQALFAGVVLLAEVASGYMADLFGRRRVLLVGALFCGLGHSLLLIAEGFWTLALYELLLGISFSLASGSDLALLYDSELALGASAERQRRVVGKIYSLGTLSGALSGAVCSLILLGGSLAEVIWVQVIVGWIPFMVALGLVEAPRQSLDREAGHGREMKRILRYLWGHSLLLRQVFVTACIWPLTTFYAVWLLQEVWRLQYIPLYLFGWIWGGLSLLTALSGRYASALEKHCGPRALLFCIGVLPIVGYLGLAVAGPLVGIAVAALFFVARGLGQVLLADALNHRIPSQFRATANSLVSFGFRACFAVTGPLVGYGLDRLGMDVILGLLAVLSALIVLVCLLPLLFSVPSRKVFRRG